MGTLLVIHLAVVAGLFITMPYGKFAHVVYRYAAGALRHRTAANGAVMIVEANPEIVIIPEGFF